MPLYFAYGSNMNEVALRTRSPQARAVSLARLPDYRFVLMSNGFASVVRDAADVVHGMLFNLALFDIAPLDLYEDVDNGLYTKAELAVIPASGEPCQALVYLGTDTTLAACSCVPGYMEAIVETARCVGLPSAYVTMLAGHLPGRAAP